MYPVGSEGSRNVMPRAPTHTEETEDLKGIVTARQSSPRHPHSPEQWRTRKKAPLTNEKKVQIWSYHKENPLVTHADIAGK